MGRTIKVKEVVEVFDKYLKDPSEDLENVYNEINSNYSQHGYKLLIRELLFKKLYECYTDYKNGKIGLDDELDVIEDIVGCDKHSGYYYINTVDELFKNCVNAMHNINYGDGAINLFPDEIDEDYFVNDYDYDEELGEATDYDLMMIAAENYLEQEYYQLNGFHTVIEKEAKKYYGIVDIPEEITEQFLDTYKDLKGTEIYDFGIGLNKEDDDNWWDETETLLTDFWKVRLKIMNGLCTITKIEDGKTEGINEELIQWYENMKLLGNGFREQYDKLSLDDFKMTDDCKLIIVNNQEVYKLFGIDEKYLECETELETEIER